MDDWKKQITESIAEACVSSFIESFAHSFPGSTISNLKVRVGSVRRTLIGDESSVTDNTNQRGSKQNGENLKRKEADRLEEALVLTKKLYTLEPTKQIKLKNDITAEKKNSLVR